MDDQLLLGKSDAKVDSAMATFEKLGVDRLRVSAFWQSHAPAGDIEEEAGRVRRLEPLQLRPTTGPTSTASPEPLHGTTSSC